MTEEVQRLKEAGADDLARLVEASIPDPQAEQRWHEIQEQKQRTWRGNIWLLWRRLPAWTVEEATYLLAGYAPPKPDTVGTHFDPATRPEFPLHKAKVDSLCQGLSKSVRNSTAGTLRYQWKPLINAAAKQAIGYAKDISALYSLAAATDRQKTPSQAVQRRDFVLEIARMLVAEGTGTESPGGIHLPINSKAFLKAAKRLDPDRTRRLLNVTPETLRVALRDRRNVNLPVIHLQGGRPPKPKD